MHTSTLDPTGTDDSYGLGAIWVNTQNDQTFICADTATNNAVWNTLSLPDQTDNEGKYLSTDGSTISWETVEGGSSAYHPYIDIRPNDFSLSDTNIGSSWSSAFNIFKCIDFSNTEDGSIWCSFELPTSFSETDNVHISLIYSLDGSDDSKNILFQTEYWAVANGETPGIGSPTSTNQTLIDSNTTQSTKREITLSGIANSDISNGDTIAIRFTRLSTNVSDTYSGTFKLLGIWVSSTTISTPTSLVDMRPNDSHFDDTDVGVVLGSTFNIFESLNFENVNNGAVWFSFDMPNDFDTTKDINLKITYMLNGADSEKVVELEHKYWAVGTGDVPNISTPDDTNLITVGTTTTQNILKKEYFDIITSNDISGDDTIVMRIARIASGVTDNYSGTFQLISVTAYQV